MIRSTGAEPAGGDERFVTLGGPADVSGFRRAVRALVAAGVAPERVSWRCEGGAGSAGLAFTGADSRALPSFVHAAQPRREASPLRLPRGLVGTLEEALLHSDRGRHDLLYRLLWRLLHEPTLRDDPLDPERLQAERMARAVRRDLHKMKAFVRFRPIARGADQPPLHVAWFEPEHHVVEASAPFFVGRFAQLRWTILTPLASLAWDGDRLIVGAGASPEDAPPADAGESLWLTYYQHTFNPARLKLKMMQKEMPRRYWKNLPEAVAIGPLTLSAPARQEAMIRTPPTEPPRGAAAARARPAESGDGAARPATLGTGIAASAAERRGALDHDAKGAAGCRRCPLYREATQAVFGEGPVDAALMFVGEQPGDQEDLHGRPFVGPSGRLLDHALGQLGIPRDQVYVTNAVKHFKFELRGKRRIHKTPAQQEAAACLDWLEREIALVRPRAIVALGATAARSVLGRVVAVTRERGSWMARADGVPVLATLHPSALLRLPPESRDEAMQAWLDDLRVAGRGPGAGSR